MKTLISWYKRTGDLWLANLVAVLIYLHEQQLSCIQSYPSYQIFNADTVQVFTCTLSQLSILIFLHTPYLFLIADNSTHIYTPGQKKCATPKMAKY